MAVSNILLYRAIFEHKYSIIEIVNRLESNILDETRMVIEAFDDTSLFGIYIYIRSCIKNKNIIFRQTFLKACYGRDMLLPNFIGILEKTILISGEA